MTPKMVAENLQIDQIRERFLTLNMERIQRTQQLMLPNQRELLELLPLLFHVQNKTLPGYLEEQTPFGVFNFAPNDKLLLSAKRQWSGFEFQMRGIYRYDIEAIFLMGSCGTVAFNRKSDFDVWVCHRPGLSKPHIAQLQKKADRIEKWFETQDIEMHFFLMNAEAFRKGKVSKLSSESSGTAQHRILLDEFYRSSIWLAGKTPFWWYVPPEQEKKYKKLQKELTEKALVSKDETIDFGGLPEIPTGEFFGAAVWQIYKGIDSPYKSILKITLMESYAGSYPDSTPLSAEFKNKIYQGITNVEILDPYLTMLARIEDHLETIKEVNRLEIIRRSFYLKLNIMLSNPYEKDNWRRAAIERLVGSWNWSPATITHLDNQKNWRLEQVGDERKLLMMHLTKSYSFLSGFARRHAKKILINQKDLSVLGRKLYSVFDRKPGKVEIFNRGIVENIKEDSITIMLLHGKDARDNWRLYRGRVTGEQFKRNRPLKQAYSLIELAAWIYFNQLISDTTQKLLYAPGSDISSNEFNVVLETLEKINVVKSDFEPESKALLKTPYVCKSLVFLNIGKQANIVGSNADKQLITGDVDVLNYGAKTECLVQTIEYCYINSWKEIFVFKFYGADGIAIWLCELLAEYRAASEQHRDVLNVTPEIHSFGSHVSYVLSTRFSNLCKSVLASFVSASTNINYYVFSAAKKFYVIHNNEDGKFEFDSYENLAVLMEKMSNPCKHFRAVSFDNLTLPGHPLKTVYARNKKDTVQLFLLEEKDGVTVYLMDELGVLFYQKLPMDSIEIVGRHFSDFVVTIIERNRLLQEDIMDSNIESDLLNYNLEIYKLRKQHAHYKASLMQLSDTPSETAYGVQVIGEVVDDKTVFTFYCDDAEFSTSESGNKIFQVVAKHIVSRRRSGKKYYVYITDLELAPTILGNSPGYIVQTVEYLKYKKKIEDSLNRVLAGL